MPPGRARNIDDGPGGGSADRPFTAVPGTRFRDVRWLDETGSTNSDTLALARDGAPEGVVVVADHQTSGRGRRGRTWVAPPGSALLVSVLLRPPAPVAGITTMAVGVAMAEAVGQVAGFTPGLKWPNDLVVAGEGGERKLAGILAETDWPPGSNIAAGWREPAPYERATVVAGVGLNLRWSGAGAAGGPGEVPAEVLDVATAVDQVTGAGVDRADVLAAFLVRLDRHYGGVVRDRSGAAVLDRWRELSATLGRHVRVDLGADDVEGVAVDVTGEGHLVVDTPEGARRTLAAGDIVHLRAR